MNKVFFALMFIFFVSNVLAQENGEDTLLLDKGNMLHKWVYQEVEKKMQGLDTTNLKGKIRYETLNKEKNDSLRKTLGFFETLIKNYPKSKLIFRARNNAALVARELKLTDKAIKYCKRNLRSKASDKESGGVGEGLMRAPFTLYKHQACQNLAEIYMESGNFRKAIRYIKKMEKKHPYRHFCGNAHDVNELYIATLYAKSYQGLGKVKKALSYILPYIFNTEWVDNKRAVELAVDILKENYDIKQLQQEFDNACMDALGSKTLEASVIDLGLHHFITFMDTDIPLLLKISNSNIRYSQTIKEAIEQSYFKQLLNE